MMSLETIVGMAQEAGVRAQQEGDEPVVLGSGQFNQKPLPIPWIGSQVEDYDLPFEEVKRFFVDSWGGEESGPALSQAEFIRQAQDLVATAGGAVYWGITQIGQFQLYVTAYRRTE